MLMDQFGLSDADVLRNLGIAMTLSSALSILLFYLVGLLSRRLVSGSHETEIKNV